MTTADDKTYNGWTNYETWNVNLWMTNDQGSQEWATQLATDIFEQSAAEGVLTRSEKARYDLGDYLKNYYDESLPESLAGVYLDLLNAALSEVNWDEIANSMLGGAELEGYEPTAD